MTVISENPSGDEWVLIRSGRAPSEIHKGSVLPEKWLEEGGNIFVRDAATHQWWGYKNKTFHPASEQWQMFANNTWEHHRELPFFERVRQYVAALLAGGKETDLLQAGKPVDWNKFFKAYNPLNKSRTEVFPNGTVGMNEAEILEFIKTNYGAFLAGGVNPREFPELIDEGLRPLCDTINKTMWGRSRDGCAGHSSHKKSHIKTGFDNAYLTVLLDLNAPQAENYKTIVQDLSKEWQARYSNLKIGLEEQKIDSQPNSRIISHGVMLNISRPSDTKNEAYFDSKECRQISASFFDELNKRISTL